MTTATFQAGPASGDDGSAPDPGDTRTGRRVLLATAGVWAVLLFLLLRHREVLSSDTLSNYVHVWFLQDRMWHGHGVPFQMPVLGHGRAFTFPYAFIPWMFSALLWPLLGEWSVGLALGLGWLFVVAGTYYAFPELRRGWWAAAVLASPALITGILLGQLPFLWAAGMFLGAIGAWRRGRRTWAIVLAALAQATHAAILLPLVGLVVAWWAWQHPDERARLLKAWAISVIPALPAAVIVFASPVTEETSPLISLWIEVETLALRALVVAVPIALVWLRGRRDRRAPAYAFAGLLLFQLAVYPVTSFQLGWHALDRHPDAASDSMARSVRIEAGKVYRVLTWGDGKWGPYSVVRRGGTLDSELFPESLHWRSFRDEADYAKFLLKRDVDYVLIQSKYYRYKTNEQELLDAMSARGGCIDGLTVSRLAHTAAYSEYVIDRGCSTAS